MYLSVRGLTKRFGGFTAVKDLSFDVAEGEILGLLGPNGSGKTTTFNMIAGSLAPTAGSITLEGAEVTGLKPNHICHMGIARTFQIPRPFGELSLLNNVALAAYYGGRANATRHKAEEEAVEALELVGLPTSPDAQVSTLGAGGLKKLELARALACRPKILLADESLGGLDEREMEAAAKMLARIRTVRKVTIVWVEHILGVLLPVVDRVLVLHHGEKIFEGKPADFARDQKVNDVYLGKKKDAE